MIRMHSLVLWMTMATAFLLGLGARSAPAQQSAGSAAKGAAEALPKDVYPDSRFRLPLLKREELDEQGKKHYDELAGRGTRTLAGFQGPSGIRLYSPVVGEHMNAVNQYLRFEAGIDGRLRELAILVSAREASNQFEWTQHEVAGLKEGLPQSTVDIIKYRKPVAGLGEKEAAIVRLGREMLGDKKVSSATFAEALRLFGKKGLVDMVSLMAHYTATAALLTAFDAHLPEGEKQLLPQP